MSQPTATHFHTLAQIRSQWNLPEDWAKVASETLQAIGRENSTTAVYIMDEMVQSAGSDLAARIAALGKGFGILSVVAADGTQVAGNLVTILNDVIADNAEVGRVFVREGIQALSELAVSSPRAAAQLVTDMTFAARMVPDLLPNIIRAGFESLPALASDDPLPVSTVLVALTKATQSNKSYIPTFVGDGLSTLPALVTKNGQAAAMLVEHLVRGAGRNELLLAAITEIVTARLPELATRDAFAVPRVIKALGGGEGMVCREFMLSAPGCSNNRQVLILFGQTAGDSTVYVGPFPFPFEEFSTRVGQPPQGQSLHPGDHRAVLATAQGALAHYNALPSFGRRLSPSPV